MQDELKAWIVARYHDNGAAVFEQNEGIVYREDDGLLLLQKLWPSVDIRRADCEHFAWVAFIDGKETDMVWLTEPARLVGPDPALAAAQAEVARLREALELADAALRGANMNMNVVERKVGAALKGE